MAPRPIFTLDIVLESAVFGTLLAVVLAMAAHP